MKATVRFKEEQNVQPNHPDKKVLFIAGEVEVTSALVQLDVFGMRYIYPLHMIARVESPHPPATPPPPIPAPTK